MRWKKEILTMLLEETMKKPTKPKNSFSNTNLMKMKHKLRLVISLDKKVIPSLLR
jgi:hypothetical protein